MKVLFLVLVGLVALTRTTLAQEQRFQKLGVKLDPWAETQIAFWKTVYAGTASGEFLIHDSMNLGHVYRTVAGEDSARKARVQVAGDLARIASLGPAPITRERLPPALLPLFSALGAIEAPSAYRFASNLERIRIQAGLKERVDAAFRNSKPYWKRMREILEEEGVPKELLLLSFVESAFDHEARSHAGAAGIWQFMPKTAMTDLRVTRSIDERHDPLKSTRAAGRFLRRNFERFRNWGLAVMAYHHGPGLVDRAIRKVGSRDPVAIIRTFKHRDFRFASRNYLFEFLAMCDVDSARGSILEPGHEAPLPAFITVSFEKRVTMRELAQRYRFNESMTRMLNPHFRSPIWSNHETIPPHYPVRLAGITLEEFRRVEYRE